MTAPKSGPNSAAPTTGAVVAGVYNGTTPSLADGQAIALQTDISGNLKVSVSSSGAASNVNIADVNGNPPAVSNPLPVELSDGTNAFGTPSNPVNVQAASLPLPTNAALETGGNLATLAGAVSGGKEQVNVAQVGGANVASAASGVQKVGIVGGAGNSLETSAGVLDQNIKNVGNSAVSVAAAGVQKVGIVGGAGTSLETSAGVLDQNIKNVGNSAVSTAASGVQKVGVVGNAGGIFDGAPAATAPANAVQQGARAATAYPTAVTDGQLAAIMADKAGRQVAVLNSPRDLVGTVQLNSSSSSLVSFIASGGASVFTDIVTFIATNESSTATIVSLSDGTTTYKFALAANGGIVINFPTPLPAASSATAWQVSNSAAVAVDYVAVYVKNK